MRVQHALLVGTLLGVTCSVNGEPRSDKKPNFVIVMADDMGYGDSSVYGGWVETPHLDRMAREGLKFTDFHSSGVVCSPTRAGLLTGRYQQRAGIPGVINADPAMAVHHTGLQTSELTFAELLAKAGYATAIFGKWHLGYHKKFNPVHHGFDRFRGFVSGNVDYISLYDRMETHDWWEGTERVEEDGYLTQLITKHAVRFIDKHNDQPFCLYVPHGAVHSPLQAPGDTAVRGPENSAAERNERARDQDETVRQMFEALDQSVGEILSALHRADVAERTLVVFLSDNGGARHCRNDPLRGGKGSVWEGGHRVPAIAWWPGKIQPGRVSDQLCISLDLMPTLLQLAGCRVPESHSLDGIDLTPLLIDEQPLGDRQLFWNGAAMREGPWKLITRAKGLKKSPALFDLSQDIGEQRNVAAEHADRVDAMLAALGAWKKDVAAGATDQPAQRDDRARQKKPASPEGAARPAQAAAKAHIKDLGGHVFDRSGRVVEIVLNRTDVTDADLRFVAAFPQLTDLSLEQTRVGDDGVQQLAGLQDLEWLNLYRTRLGDRGLRHLAKLPRLQHLPIGETRISDAGLADVKEMKQLHYLGLRGNRVTDAGLAHLQGLADLTGLHLGQTQVTDAGMRHLAQLTKLKNLWLHDTRVSDNAVPDLARLTSLQELVIHGTSISPAGIRRLREALPKCEIVDVEP